MSPGLFGQPSAYAGFVPFAHEPALAGMYPTPFLQNPFLQNPFVPSPYAGAHHPAQQIVLVLGQLAQQIAVQTAVTQQISIALQQLVQQLAVQGLPSHQGAGLSAFQGAYGGFTPQAQAWGANRAQTIQ